MRTPAERLVAARETAGLDTAAEGAERTGVKYDTYVQHERGARGISKEKAARYAAAFGVDVAWLLYGRGKAIAGMVPVIGRVGANPDGAVLFATGDDPQDLAPIQPGGTDKAVALEVVGHSMRGIADEGALIYFEHQHTPPTLDMLGHVVVVETEHDEVLIKRLLRGSEPGRYDLESLAGPLRQDVRLRWAAHISAIIPPYFARRVIVRRGEAA